VQLQQISVDLATSVASRSSS